MKVERFTIKACCGKVSNIFKIDQPVTKDLLSSLLKLGFKEGEHFTKAGILYADNLDFIITAPFGADRLQIRCKKKECSEKLNDFEALLLQLG
jgi:hypothetical protein